MSADQPRTTLGMPGEVKVVVPDSLELITPYVLAEQGDWFEDEIKFVRATLKPGQRAIDIGANYGLYSLTIAAAVGSDGHVWSFEPASATAAWLAASIAENGFEQVTLDQRALSDHCGIASLALDTHSELNAISHVQTPDIKTEQVVLSTLDSLLETYGWSGIDFVKIDAEGEEAAIIRGGSRFFAHCSPLIQYEIKAGSDVSLDLVEAFAALDYRSYRLVPGLGVLIPFDPDEPVDGYQLNLFACRADRAALLARDGYLVLTLNERAEEALDAAIQADAGSRRYHWEAALSAYPYANELALLWKRASVAGRGVEVEQALGLHAMAHDAALSLDVRVAALRRSHSRLGALCDECPVHYRLASFARVAGEWGARQQAVEALGRFAMLYREFDPGEAFLPASPRFDSIDPCSRFREWTLAFTLEELERRSTFSSFYTGAAAHKRLAMVCNLGFASEEMRRRKALVERRFPDGANGRGQRL